MKNVFLIICAVVTITNLSSCEDDTEYTKWLDRPLNIQFAQGFDSIGYHIARENESERIIKTQNVLVDTLRLTIDLFDGEQLIFNNDTIVGNILELDLSAVNETMNVFQYELYVNEAYELLTIEYYKEWPLFK